MKVKCTNCNAVLNIGVEKIITTILIACPKCQQQMMVNPPLLQTNESVKVEQPPLEIAESMIEEKTTPSVANTTKTEKKSAREWWSERTKTQKWIIAILILIILGQVFKNNDKNNSSSSTNSSTNNNSQSEEASKRAYRAGYADGQLLYGDPNPPSGEYFLANHPEISGADKVVYLTGYRDGAVGRAKEY